MPLIQPEHDLTLIEEPKEEIGSNNKLLRTDQNLYDQPGLREMETDILSIKITLPSEDPASDETQEIISFEEYTRRVLLQSKKQRVGLKDDIPEIHECDPETEERIINDIWQNFPERSIEITTCYAHKLATAVSGVFFKQKGMHSAVSRYWINLAERIFNPNLPELPYIEKLIDYSVFRHEALRSTSYIIHPRQLFTPLLQSLVPVLKRHSGVLEYLNHISSTNNYNHNGNLYNSDQPYYTYQEWVKRQLDEAIEILASKEIFDNRNDPRTRELYATARQRLIGGTIDRKTEILTLRETIN